ncbi:MAG TPA: aminomethyltransferase family protein, partial [Ilumatobacteraceae bacterium]
GLSMVGLTVAGPRSRDVLQKVTNTSLSNTDFPFMSFRKVDLGMASVWLSRMTYTGDLGYEIWMQPEHQRYLFDLLWDAGSEFDMRLFGFRALITMRLEKNFGTWFREYRPIYTPLEAGMDRVLKFDHEFIGRSAVEAEVAEGGPKRKLVMFVVEPDEASPADVIGDEPIWHRGPAGDTVVGWITSGGYAHYSGASLAWGYIPTELAEADTTGFEIEIIGNRRPARLQPEAILDPTGSRMRS